MRVFKLYFEVQIRLSLFRIIGRVLFVPIKKRDRLEVDYVYVQTLLLSQKIEFIPNDWANALRIGELRDLFGEDYVCVQTSLWSLNKIELFRIVGQVPASALRIGQKRDRFGDTSAAQNVLRNEDYARVQTLLWSLD